MKNLIIKLLLIININYINCSKYREFQKNLSLLKLNKNNLFLKDIENIAKRWVIYFRIGNIICNEYSKKKIDQKYNKNIIFWKKFLENLKNKKEI